MQTPAAGTIESGLGMVEAAIAQVAVQTQREQSARPDALPAIISAKVEALDALNAAWMGLRRALAGAGFGGSLHALARHGADRDLRERANRLIESITAAQAENAISQKLIHSKLNFSRTVGAALHAARDEAALAPTLSASRFSTTTAGSSRRLGQA